MGDVIYLFLVEVLWGVTNPLIKKGSAGINQVKEDNKAKQFFKEILYLITNWKYLVPFLINQSGSVLYFLTLQSSSLTFAVPITNSVALVMTAISGWYLGESTPKLRTIIGSALVLLGTFCYVLDSRV